MASDKRVVLTADQAMGLLPDGEAVHVIVDTGACLLGAGWDRTQVLDLVRSGARCEVGGDQCRRYDHGLVVWRDKQPLFVATRDDVDWDALEAKILGGK